MDMTKCDGIYLCKCGIRWDEIEKLPLNNPVEDRQVKCICSLIKNRKHVDMGRCDDPNRKRVPGRFKRIYY